MTQTRRPTGPMLRLAGASVLAVISWAPQAAGQSGSGVGREAERSGQEVERSSQEAERGTAAQQSEGETLRDLDVGPYRTPRAGESFRATVFGRQIDVIPPDSRDLSSWDVGFALTPGLDEVSALPFASLYYWRNREDLFLRATVAGVFNDIYYAAPVSEGARTHFVASLWNFTVPVPQEERFDGVNIDDEGLIWGQVRPAVGLGLREQVGKDQSNLWIANAVLEPGFQYFGRGDDTADFFQLPSTTAELRVRVQTVYDQMDRNLLRLPHEGYSLGGQVTYGYRTNWDDWGIPGTVRSFDADETRDYVSFTGFAIGATGVPFVRSEKHRLMASTHFGFGDSLDRFSAPRVGGGPQPHGEELFAQARPFLPGAAINEFYPENYAIGSFVYRYEPVFFAYLDLAGFVAWLDRDRLKNNTVVRQEDTFAAVGGRLTTGFVGRTRLQMFAGYNFDVVRNGEFGGFEFHMHISGAF